jgi:hypothetical protein
MITDRMLADSMRDQTMMLYCRYDASWKITLVPGMEELPKPF